LNNTIALNRASLTAQLAPFDVTGASGPASIKGKNIASQAVYDISADAYEISDLVPKKEPFQQTALQKHVGFFDLNGNGTVSVSETAEGLQSLGIGTAKSWLGGLFVNLVIGTMTRGYPSTSIDLNNIQKGKHEGDTGAFNADGQFDRDKFNDFFKKFDKDGDGNLNRQEIENFVNRNPKSFIGKLFVQLELPVLLKLAGEDVTLNGETTRVLSREKLEKFYDGSLLYEMAGRQKHT